MTEARTRHTLNPACFGVHEQEKPPQREAQAQQLQRSSPPEKSPRSDKHPAQPKINKITYFKKTKKRKNQEPGVGTISW